jgi:hypothetical protein
MGARNRVEIFLSYRPAGLHSLAELVPRNQFWGSLKILKIRARSQRKTKTGELPRRITVKDSH